jgi:phosphatidylinositol alpha-1,6-mannosyltransferase
MYRRVWALGRRHRPTAIHCAKALPEGLIGLAAGRTLGIPYVCFAHGEELTLARTTRELRWLTRRVLHGASQLVANSHNTKRLLVNDWGVVEARVIVMHPGVDAARFVPATPDPRVRSTLGWTDRRVVLTVGALQKRKGQDTVIRSLPAIARRCPDVLYVVAGEGWERPYLEGLVDELQVHDYVQFRGTPRDDELIQCYQQCDLFVLANRQVGWDFEGFGIVLLEAQACGKPVVAGVSGGAPETLEAGVSGEVVDGDSVDSVAEVVASLLDDPDRRARMGAAARRRIERHFTWDILARQAAELLE